MRDKAFRRAAMIVGIARQAAASSEASPCAFHQLGFPTGELHDGVFGVQQFGFASAPLPGTDHIVVHVEGDRTKGISIATNDQRARPQTLAGGEAMMHDALGANGGTGQTVHLSAAGIVIDGGGLNLPITIRNAPQINVTADTQVTITAPTVRVVGNLNVTGEITAKCDSAPITLTPHTHTDSRGGTTSAPIPGT